MGDEAEAADRPRVYRYQLWWPIRVLFWLIGGLPDSVKVVTGISLHPTQPFMVCIVDGENMGKGFGMSFLNLKQLNELIENATACRDRLEVFRPDIKNER